MDKVKCNYCNGSHIRDSKTYWKHMALLTKNTLNMLELNKDCVEQTELVSYCPSCNRVRKPKKIAFMPKEVILYCPEGHWQTYQWSSNQFEKSAPVYGKPNYCDKCHQEQFPEDCCVCDGKNPELKKRLDEDKKDFKDMMARGKERQKKQDEANK